MPGLTGHLRHTAPDVEATGIGVVSAADGVHDAAGEFAAATVFGIEGLVPLGTGIEGGHGGFLNAPEHAGVHLGLHLEDFLDDGRVSNQHPYAPSGHVVALGQGVEFHAALPGAGNGQYGLGLVEDEAVRVVVDKEYSVAACKGHQPFKHIPACRSPGGHVGVVGPHQFHAREVH